MKLIWTLAVSGAVLACGGGLLLRWLAAAGLPVPLEQKGLTAARVEVDRREALGVFSAALAFRLAVFLAVTAVVLLRMAPEGGLAGALDIWKRWDAWHYVNLVELGYSGYVEDGKNLFVVFFPLYVWLVRLARLLVGDTMAAGLLVSFLCYAGGCLSLYRLAAWEYGRAAARRTVVFLSVFPYAFFLGGVMTEGLYLLTTATALWHIRRHRWLAAGVWGALAALTRMHGVLLIIAAGAELVEHLGRFDWKAIFRRLPVLAMPLLGTAVYLGMNARVTGNPFAFVRMQEHWSQGFCWISDTLWYVLQNAISYYRQDVRVQIWIPTLLLFPVFFALLISAGRRHRSMYTLYGYACLVLNYSLSWLLSAGRYLSCCVPFFLFAAVLTRGRPRVTAAAVAVMGAGFAVNLSLYLSGAQIM